jgi:hypothetical protein
MLLAQKAAMALALASLVKSQEQRKALMEQIDAGLSFMTMENQWFAAGSANAIFDAAASEAMRALKRDGWNEATIAQRVKEELRNARVMPTVRGVASA